jgi:hypothetical protein
MIGQVLDTAWSKILQTKFENAMAGSSRIRQLVLLPKHSHEAV